MNKSPQIITIFSPGVIPEEPATRENPARKHKRPKDCQFTVQYAWYILFAKAMT